MKNNYFVKNIINSPFIILVMAYFFLGSILYISWHPSGNIWINLIDIITSFNYLTIFIFPVFYILSSLTYKKINNTSIICRFKTRSQFMKYTVLSTFKITTIIFIFYLIILFICCNFIGNYSFDIIKVSYWNNLTFLITKVVKIYIYILLLQYISIITHFKFKNNTLSGILNLLLYLIVYLFKYLNFKSCFIIMSLNFVTHLSYGDIYLKNGLENVISSIIFFSFYTGIVLIIKKFSLNKIDFLEKE